MSLFVAVKFGCIFKPFLAIHAPCELLISGEAEQNRGYFS